jgi:hypothetical protein
MSSISGSIGPSAKPAKRQQNTITVPLRERTPINMKTDVSKNPNETFVLSLMRSTELKNLDAAVPTQNMDSDKGPLLTSPM